MVKNLFYENQNERIETTGTVHTGNKLAALRFFTDGQVASVTVQILSIQKQTLESWVRFENKCQPMSLATS